MEDLNPLKRILYFWDDFGFEILDLRWGKVTLGGKCSSHIRSCHRQLQNSLLELGGVVIIVIVIMIMIVIIIIIIIMIVIIIIKTITPRLGRTRGVGRRPEMAEPAMAGMKKGSTNASGWSDRFVQFIFMI